MMCFTQVTTESEAVHLRKPRNFGRSYAHVRPTSSPQPALFPSRFSEPGARHSLGRRRLPVKVDGQLAQAAQHQPVPVAPSEVTAIDGEAEIRKAVEQLPERDGRLEPREWSAQAEVDAVTEREV